MCLKAEVVVMAIFEVELDGKLIKRIEADDFTRNGDTYFFFDKQNNTVGSVVAKPGMIVTKGGHVGPVSH
jgi:hypothetical protein